MMARAGDERQEPQTGTQFRTWRLLQDGEPDSLHILTSLGAVSVCFTLDVGREIKGGLTGIALYNSDNLLLWGTSTPNFTISAGRWELVYNLAQLPLRPGSYHWLVSIFDDYGLVDLWHAVPMLVIDTDQLARAPEEWQGMLNLPWELEVQ